MGSPKQSSPSHVGTFTPKTHGWVPNSHASDHDLALFPSSTRSSSESKKRKEGKLARMLAWMGGR